MALFKIYSGTADDFDGINGFSNYALHPGYAYFFEDSGEFVVDTETGRYTVNASTLIKNNGTAIEFIDVDEVLYSPDGITKNALLVGGDSNTVRAIAIDAGALVIGDATKGIAGLKGTGALYASTAGIPQFGTLPLSAGGLGATDAAGARTNLSVYSKTETDTRIGVATSVIYTATLSASGWSGNDTDGYTYSYANTAIRCGKDGNVHPIITYVDNREEYSKISGAEATVGVGIVFTSPTKPENNIAISIIDVG